MQADGTFYVDRIASGVPAINVNWPADTDLRPIVVQSGRVSGGGSTDVIIETRPTVQIRGQVITADTSQPVVGANVAIRESISGSSMQDVVTDDDGWYTARVIPDKLTIQVWPMSVAATHQYPKIIEVDVRDENEPVTVQTMTAKPMEVLHGRLVTADGKPASRRITAFVTEQWGHLQGAGVTDDNGNFEWRLDSHSLEQIQKQIDNRDGTTAGNYGRFILLPERYERMPKPAELVDQVSQFRKLPMVKIASAEPLVLRISE